MLFLIPSLIIDCFSFNFVRFVKMSYSSEEKKQITRSVKILTKIWFNELQIECEIRFTFQLLPDISVSEL